MDLKYLDQYFQVDKNKLPVTGQTIPSDFALWLRDQGYYSDLGSRVFCEKLNQWFDRDRHSSIKKLELKEKFGIDWDVLPEKFKDINKHPISVTCSLNSSIWKDERYVNYLRKKWNELRNILIDRSFINNEYFTFTDSIYGKISEKPFIYAFAETANCILHDKEYAAAERSFNKFKAGKGKSFSLVEPFLSSLSNQVQNHNDEYKEATLAFTIELIRKVDELSNLKNVA